MAQLDGRVALVTGATSGSARRREIASLVTYLVSDEAAFITGAVLAADGGWSAQ